MVQSQHKSSSSHILFNSPELLEMQRAEFYDFLKQGIPQALQNIFPLRVQSSKTSVELRVDAENFKLLAPEASPQNCILNMKTYSCKLYVPIKTLFYNATRKITYQSKPEWVLMCELPIMTKRGHFVVNGSPRVIVHQVVRSPGIYFQQLKKDENPRDRFYGDIIPVKGAWLRLQITKKGWVEARFKRGKKVKASHLQTCLRVIENQLPLSLNKAEFQSNQLNHSLPNEMHVRFDTKRNVRTGQLTNVCKRYFPKRSQTPLSVYKLSALSSQRVSPNLQTDDLCERDLDRNGQIYDLYERGEGANPAQRECVTPEQGRDKNPERCGGTGSNCASLKGQVMTAVETRDFVELRKDVFKAFKKTGFPLQIPDVQLTPDLTLLSSICNEGAYCAHPPNTLPYNLVDQSQHNCFDSTTVYNSEMTLFGKTGILSETKTEGVAFVSTYNKLYRSKEERIKEKQRSPELKYKKNVLPPPTLPKRKACAERLFSTFKIESRYSLGELGRKRINAKFGLLKTEKQLTSLDLQVASDWLFKLRRGEESVDDIDHLQNRRVRTSSELIQMQFENGVERLKNSLIPKLQEWSAFLERATYPFQIDSQSEVFDSLHLIPILKTGSLENIPPEQTLSSGDTPLQPGLHEDQPPSYRKFNQLPPTTPSPLTASSLGFAVALRKRYRVASTTNKQDSRHNQFRYNRSHRTLGKRAHALTLQRCNAPYNVSLCRVSCLLLQAQPWQSYGGPRDNVLISRDVLGSKIVTGARLATTRLNSLLSKSDRSKQNTFCRGSHDLVQAQPIGVQTEGLYPVTTLYPSEQVFEGRGVSILVTQFCRVRSNLNPCLSGRHQTLEANNLRVVRLCQDAWWDIKPQRLKQVRQVNNSGVMGGLVTQLIKTGVQTKKYEFITDRNKEIAFASTPSHPLLEAESKESSESTQPHLHASPKVIGRRSSWLKAQQHEQGLDRWENQLWRSCTPRSSTPHTSLRSLASLHGVSVVPGLGDSKEKGFIKHFFSSKHINGALREFFGSNPLSQYMDQTNPLSEITHKRRISSLGFGGVSRESAGMAIRGIHATHYGRICPIETPEGKNAGLVNSLSFYTKLDKNGFLKTPYYRVSQGQVQYELGFSFCDAKQESASNLKIAPTDLQESCNNVLRYKKSTADSIPVRGAQTLLDVFEKVKPQQVDCIGISQIQMISVATSLIPFLEHNDANRALMGSNMQRQAVPLLIPERPIIGTGLESLVLAASGHVTQSEIAGFVSYVSSNKIVIQRVLCSKAKSLVHTDTNSYSNGNAVQRRSHRSHHVVRDDVSGASGYKSMHTNCRFVICRNGGGTKAYKSKLYQSNLLGSCNPKHEHQRVTTSYTRKPNGLPSKEQNGPPSAGILIQQGLVSPSAQALYSLTHASKTNISFSLSRSKTIPGGNRGAYEVCARARERLKKRARMEHPTLVECVHSFDETNVTFTELNQTFARSNQNTCIIQKPLVQESDWVQRGDLLTDCSASERGELAVGKNVFVAYIPWEGYNFEDAIVINERLVKEHVYTSLHIERYVFQAEDTKDWYEWFTPKVPGRSKTQVRHLDRLGLPEIGSFVKEGHILVGKIRYLKKEPIMPYEKLVCDIVGKTKYLGRDKSLLVPRGVEGRVINYRVISRFQETLPNNLRAAGAVKAVHVFLGEKRPVQVGDKMSGRHGNKGVISTVLPKQDMPYMPDGTAVDIVLNPLGVPSRMNVGQVLECLVGLAATYLHQHFKITAFDERYGVEASKSLVFLKLYQARLQSQQNWLFQTTFPGKTRLVDGRSGKCFDQLVTVGKAYILKLMHMVSEKIHARATGPYAFITQQPLRGRSHRGGQRLGEMEVWALEGFGAAYTLQELLTKKSDDFSGRRQIVKAILPLPEPFDVAADYMPWPDVDGATNFRAGETRLVIAQPDIFKVLLCELQALCLDFGIYVLTPESVQQKLWNVMN